MKKQVFRPSGLKYLSSQMTLQTCSPLLVDVLPNPYCHPKAWQNGKQGSVSSLHLQERQALQTEIIKLLQKFLSSMRVSLLILHCIYQALQIALLRRILSLHSSLRPLKFFHFGDTNLPLWTQNKYVFVRTIRSWHFGWWLINRDTNSCNEPFNCLFCSCHLQSKLDIHYTL